VKNLLALAMMLCSTRAFAADVPSATQQQQEISPEQMEMFRKDIRSQKKQTVAQNLKLSDDEATKFWPIYDKYTAELVKANDKKYAAIKEFAEKFGTISDDKAIQLTKDWQQVDIEAAQLRAKYLPIVTDAIGGKKAATFAQIDRRLMMIIDLQLSSRLPLVQSQK
jgi:hypothetical protein